jgi:hypothetical protein
MSQSLQPCTSRTDGVGSRLSREAGRLLAESACLVLTPVGNEDDIENWG